jgi:hypothetical protein
MRRGGGESGLGGYGDLKGRTRAGGSDKADQTEGGIGRTPEVRVDGVDCSVTHWARCNGITA